MTPTTTTVREIALANPASMRVFEQFGIDYCCGGRKPLAEACEVRNIAVDEVIAALERAAATPGPQAADWSARPLSEMVSHIVSTHHLYVKRELPRLAELAERVVNRHGGTRPELPAIQARLAQLSEELLQHLAKEETILFPYIDHTAASEPSPTPFR